MRKGLLTLVGVLLLLGFVFANAPYGRTLPAPRWTPQQGGPAWMNPQLQNRLRDALKERAKTVLPKLYGAAVANRFGTMLGYRLLDRLPDNATLSEVKTLSGAIKEIFIAKDGGLVVTFESDGKVYELKGGHIIWREVGLKAGDKLSVTGRIMKVDDKEYIIVDKATIGNKTYDADELLKKRVQARVKQWAK